MSNIENWITENKNKLPNNYVENFKKIGFQVKNVIPPIYESYALIYHPYKIPKGEIRTEREDEEIFKIETAKRINSLIEKEVGISTNELPLEIYDIEEKIKQKLRVQKLDEETINKKLKKIERECLKIVFDPIANMFDSLNKGEIPDGFDQEFDLREISWKELYSIYKIEFTNKSTWATISKKVNSTDYIIGQEMPEMDIIPKSVIEKIITFLKSQNVERVNLNQQVNLKTDNIPIEDLINIEEINLIASIKKDWLFINPNDFCRTIVAGKSRFIKKVIESKLFEISNPITETHRLDINSE